jgi:DNA-binding transcriptional LysR family regulator
MARNLVDLSATIHETITSLENQVIGVLKLGCSTTAGKYVLPQMIAGFLDLHPAVQVTCYVGTRGSALKMLLDGNAHLIVTSLYEASKELEYRTFITDPVVLIVPPDHTWAQRESIRVEELPEGRYILREIDSGTQQTVIQALAEHNMCLSDLPTVMILGSSEAIQVAVAESIGVAFVSRRAAVEGIAAGRVVEVPVKGLQMTQQLFMVRRSHQAATGTQAAFWDYVYSSGNHVLLDNGLSGWVANPNIG